MIVSLARMRTSELAPSARSGAGRGQLREGSPTCAGGRTSCSSWPSFFFAGTFGLNFQMTTALMATEVYGKGAGEFGILGSILAVGSLAGSLLAARRVRSAPTARHRRRHRLRQLEIVAGLMPTYLTFAAILPLCGFAALTMITAANAFVQMSVDARVRGRVMALYMAIFMGGTPLGSPLLGWIADQSGPAGR